MLKEGTLIPLQLKPRESIPSRDATLAKGRHIKLDGTFWEWSGWKRREDGKDQDFKRIVKISHYIFSFLPHLDICGKKIVFAEGNAGVPFKNQ